MSVIKADKKQVSMKNLFRVAGWIISIACFFAILGASVSTSGQKYLSNLYIKVDHDSGLYFVDEDGIRRAIESHLGEAIEGKALRAVDFTDIEERLEKNPYIEKAEVYSSTKGAVRVEIRQREPLFRIVNNSGVSYYFDANGFKIPTSSKFTPRVVVVTGNVENAADTSVMTRLMALCSFISNDEFWKAQFEQIYAAEDGEFRLIPKLGNHIIVLGRDYDLEGSFSKLRTFYSEVLKNFDADDFRIINLKYKNQIVCTKNPL